MTAIATHENRPGNHASNLIRLQDDASGSMDVALTSSSSDLDADNRLRPFGCSYPGCSQRFKRRYTLKDHMNAHTGVKPFVCPVRSCSRRFTTSGNLARHKRLHPWLDAPQQCFVPGCSCVFANVAKLERHMRTHFGETTGNRCLVATCGKVFSTKGNLRRHRKHAHSETNDQDVRRPNAPPILAEPWRCETGQGWSGESLSSDEEILDALSWLLGLDEDENMIIVTV